MKKDKNQIMMDDLISQNLQILNDLEGKTNRENKRVAALMPDIEQLKQARKNWGTMTNDQKINMLAKAVFALIIEHVEDEEVENGQ